ncbi:MAG: hypothetical protein QXS88_02730 [Candidatus Bilamarchaeaceae archaeon]
MRYLAAFLLTIALSFAQSCSPIGTVTNYLTNEFMSLFFITLVITVILLALIKNFSGLINMPQLDAWIKNELREVIVTVILFVIIVSSFGALDLIVKAITNVDCTRDAALKAVDGMVERYDTAYQSLIKAMTRLRFISSYSSYASLGFILYTGMSNAKYAGVYPLINSLSMAASGLTNGIFLYMAIEKLLNFFYVTMPMLIPISFSLRAFPLTRSIGNTLIAICIGLVIFFPLSVILVAQLNNIVGVPTPEIPKNELSDLVGGEPGWLMKVGIAVATSGLGEAKEGGLASSLLSPVCKNMVTRFVFNVGEYPFGLVVCLPFLIAIVTAPFYPTCVEITANIIYPALAALASLGLAALIMVVDHFTLNFDPEKAFNIIYVFLRDVNILVVISYVNVLLIGLITISGIRSISATLGGELYLPGVEKLI